MHEEHFYTLAIEPGAHNLGRIHVCTQINTHVSRVLSCTLSNVACPEGLWGERCSEQCLCENGGDCDPINGSCNCTTAPGWIGEYCNIGKDIGLSCCNIISKLPLPACVFLC